MNLTLTHRGDYVIRAALYLAARWEGGDGYRKIREVAEAMELPPSYTPQILGLLARAGLAEAKAGRTGGYRLSRPPERISLLEVVEAGEGHLSFERCPLRGGPCHWDDVCAMHPAWSRAAESMRETLGRTSLAELAEVDRRLAAGEPIVGAPAGHRVVPRRRRGRGGRRR